VEICVSVINGKKLDSARGWVPGTQPITGSASSAGSCNKLMAVFQEANYCQVHRRMRRRHLAGGTGPPDAGLSAFKLALKCRQSASRRGLIKLLRRVLAGLSGCLPASRCRCPGNRSTHTLLPGILWILWLLQLLLARLYIHLF